MKHLLMARLWGLVVLTSMSVAVAQSVSPPPPPPPPSAPDTDEIRIIERDFEFIGPRRSGSELGIETWELTPRMLTRMADELALTPAQQGKITEIMATYRPKMRELRRQLMSESQQLRQLGPEADDFDVRSKAAADRMGALSADLVVQGSALRKQVWGVLTPEQRVRLAQRQGNMRERRQNRSRSGEMRWSEKQGGERHQEKRRIIIRQQADARENE